MLDHISFISNFNSIAFEYDEDDLKKYVCILCDHFNVLIEELNFLFTNNTEIIEFNIELLKHNYSTDIITIPYSYNPICSDIIISIEQVHINSIDYKVSFFEELYRVIAHGLLHLFGYNDKSDDDKILMRKKEDFCLSLHNVPRETNN